MTATDVSWLDEARQEFGSLVDCRPEARAAARLDAWPLTTKRLAAGAAPALPAAVASPRSTEDVSRLLVWAAERGVAVVPRGGGSSVTGAVLATTESLVLDLARLDQVLEIDCEDGHVTVQAGVRGDELERVLAAHGMTTWFSPQSLDRSTVGGWVATRATGQLSSRFGGIEDLVAGLTVALSGGEVVKIGAAPRAAVGPDLASIFVGSEGALGVVTEAVLRIRRTTPLCCPESWALPDIRTGVALLRELMQADLRPALLRLYDAAESRRLDLSGPAPEATLLVAFAGHPLVAGAEERATSEILSAAGGRRLGTRAVETWLEYRYDFSPIERRLAQPGGYAETIEVAHGWHGILETYEAMKERLAPLADEVLGHFSHTYLDGTSLYLILLGSARDDVEAVRRLEAIWETAMTTALETGAVISHHHGVGQARRPYLAAQLGAAAPLLARLKTALDPAGILHPESLRLA